VSDVAAEFARKVFGVETVVIPNMVDVDLFANKPIINKKLTIIFLGRLVERKGCGYLLKAIKQLDKSYDHDYRVLIGGKGPLLDKLKKYAKTNKLSKVKFLGFIEEKDKGKLLSGADIAVFPSTGGESFGISLIEAMASGARVVLGGDNIGYRGVLSEHPDLLIDPKDTVGFANRLQYFLEHKKAREAAAKWSKDNINQYDVDVVGKKTVLVYRKGN
jgi:phosphatidylinositol alpha-mannosyltransferase